MNLQFDRYYRYTEFTDILHQFAREFPGLISLESVGKSHEGRDIWVVTATNTATGPAADKPAYWVDANIHASELAGGAAALYLIGGTHALIWGYFVSTVVLWHLTFTINSLAHVWGARRYPTSDDSRNNPLLAILTLGEGWHNNHHHYQRSARQGFYWWEIDLSYYALKTLELCRIVWDVEGVPRHVRDQTAKPGRVRAAATSDRDDGTRAAA